MATTEAKPRPFSLDYSTLYQSKAMQNPIESFTLEVKGLTLRADVLPVYDMGRPWDNSDGHGPVTEYVPPRIGRYFSRTWPEGKRPGQRPLSERWLYDWQGAIEQAQREGWGLAPDALAALTAKLGRKPTPRQIRAEAVRRDFEFLRGWCIDEWHYCGVSVALLDDEGEEVSPTVGRAIDSLWGIEYGHINGQWSEYHKEVAQELAEGIVAEHVKETQEAAEWAARDVATLGA